MASKKLLDLTKILRGMGKVVLAFSGGVDSTFLLKAAIDALGRKNVLAVTAMSDAFPEREYACAKKLAGKLNAKFMTVLTKETENKNFIRNPVNRCYYCKSELFTRLQAIAKEKGYSAVIDGSNFDDRKDMRHGSRAAKELGVLSPLDEARIGKDDIRRFSRLLSLPTWNKQSYACLASRFPYHDKITKGKLKKVDKAESFLLDRGFWQVRVRAHKNIARIELSQSDIKRISASEKLKRDVAKKLKELGFSYVTLDLDGYRTGSMNEVIGKKRRRPAKQPK